MQEERNRQWNLLFQKIFYDIFVQARKLTEGLRESCSADGMRKSFSRDSEIIQHSRKTWANARPQKHFEAKQEIPGRCKLAEDELRKDRSWKAALQLRKLHGTLCGNHDNFHLI